MWEERRQGGYRQEREAGCGRGQRRRHHAHGRAGEMRWLGVEEVERWRERERDGQARTTTTTPPTHPAHESRQERNANPCGT